MIKQEEVSQDQIIKTENLKSQMTREMKVMSKILQTSEGVQQKREVEARLRLRREVKIQRKNKKITLIVFNTS